MLRTFAFALLAIAMSVGVADAKRMVTNCADGQQATKTCLCGSGGMGKPVTCKKGQWCHSSSHMCGS